MNTEYRSKKVGCALILLSCAFFCIVDVQRSGRELSKDKFSKQVFKFKLRSGKSQSAPSFFEDGNSEDQSQENQPEIIPEYSEEYSSEFSPEQTDEPPETGSFANCVKFKEARRTARDYHPDMGILTAACHKISYRAPRESFRNAGELIVGVLSEAGGPGPERRESIRNTWGKDQGGVFFIVAGPWVNIADEYEEKKDLVWIDEVEVYDGERSVLTLKTYAFISIVKHLSYLLSENYYIFKTDDDVYLHMEKLQKVLFRDVPDYWGVCNAYQRYRAERNRGFTWSISEDLYPEPLYPHYCQGAGFALSKKFVDCALDGGHVAQVRYMPFEDVAVGLLAERCNITPIGSQGGFAVYRTGGSEYEGIEREIINFKNGEKIDRAFLPPATMEGKILQHRVYDTQDMEDFHKSVLDESNNDDRF